MSHDGWGQWLLNSSAFTLAGGAVAWFVNLVVQRRKHREEIAQKKEDRETLLNQHASGLAVELLKIANSEIGKLKQQLAEFQSQQPGWAALEREVGYLDEALFHVNQLLEPDPAIGREAAENEARAFYGRMIRLRQVEAKVRQREQVRRAVKSLDDLSHEGDVP